MPRDADLRRRNVLQGARCRYLRVATARPWDQELADIGLARFEKLPDLWLATAPNQWLIVQSKLRESPSTARAIVVWPPTDHSLPTDR